MDDQSKLWQGGAWERSQNNADLMAALISPNTAKIRQRRRGVWNFALFLLVITMLTAVISAVSHFGVPDSLLSLFPDSDNADPDFGFSYTDEEHSQNGVTTIPRAETGGSARLTLCQDTGQPLTLKEIYDKNLPSIVYIQAWQNTGVSSGTGIVLSEDGYIITNEHVISGASRAQVVLSTNQAFNAQLVGVHPDMDLAVLKIETSGLIPAEFGNSGNLREGDTVVAIGNPLGSSLRGTMTEGIVSAINRSVNVDGVTMSLIQTTAALNPGNSGGALINDRGQVIGVTTLKMMSKYETIEGLGFAVPSRAAKGIVDQLVAAGVALTPALGIRVWSNLEEDGGLKVESVDPSSDAYEKGLQAGDVILAVNGEPIVDSSTLPAIKETMGVGDSMRLTIQRSGEVLELEIVLMDAALFD